MNNKTYYDVMGLSQHASEKEIKTAYRRLARKYHPDLNKEADAEAQFKTLGEAYEVLKDVEKRKAYDQALKDAEYSRAHHTQSHQNGYNWQGAGMDDAMAGDLFESLFGQGGFRQARQQGADRRGVIHISLEDAYRGVDKKIEFTGGGPALNVKIPKGVKSGQQIRLTGQGESGMQGGPKGDLYLTIEVDKHPLFDVMGGDIYLTLPVTPWEVALGATIKIPTLAGPVDLKIPEGSQGGQTLRLKKRGLPGEPMGDQYVILKIIIPKPTTALHKACYETMAKEMPFDPRKTWGGHHG